jgi:uncharacterized membrane protein YqiK
MPEARVSRSIVAVSERARSFEPMADRLPLSSALRSAAEAEREVALDRVKGLSAQADRLRALADAADDDHAAAVRLLEQLDEILGIAPQMSISQVDEALRGQRLRQVAIHVLKSRRGASATVHYREWYDLLVADGHRVAGKDPVATFLTQVSRTSEVEAVGRRTGMYRLVAA